MTTPPSCLGYYKAGKCEGCIWIEVCRRLIAKDRLKPLLEAVSEVKKILQGESLG
jgi:hypothetical protein